MNFKSSYLWIVGLIVFAYLIYKIDVVETIKIFRNTSYPLIIVAFLFFILSLIINFLRWHYIVNCLGTNLKRGDAIKISFRALFAENTPGRIGEPILKAVYLNKFAKTPPPKAMFSTVFHKFTDVWSAVIQAMLVIIILFFTLNVKVFILVPGVVFLFVLILTFFIAVYNQKIGLFIVKPLFRAFVPGKYKEKMKKNLLEFYGNFKEIDGKVLTISFIYDLIEVIVTGIFLYLIFLSVGQEVSLINAIFAIPLLTIGAGLPLSISGIGIREGILVFYFGLFGVKPEIGIVVGLLFLIIKVISIVPGLIIGLIDQER